MVVADARAEHQASPTSWAISLVRGPRFRHGPARKRSTTRSSPVRRRAPLVERSPTLPDQRRWGSYSVPFATAIESRTRSELECVHRPLPARGRSTASVPFVRFGPGARSDLRKRPPPGKPRRAFLVSPWCQRVPILPRNTLASRTTSHSGFPRAGARSRGAACLDRRPPFEHREDADGGGPWPAPFAESPSVQGGPRRVARPAAVPRRAAARRDRAHRGVGLNGPRRRPPLRCATPLRPDLPNVPVT